MITKQKQLFYFVGDKPFSSLKEAQKADLVALMPDAVEGDLGNIRERLADWMIENAQSIVDTLTTTPKSRLRARKLHGASRKVRKTKPLTEEQKATA